MDYWIDEVLTSTIYYSQARRTAIKL